MDIAWVGLIVYLSIGTTFLMQRTLLKLARRTPFVRPLWLFPIRAVWFIIVTPAIFLAATVCFLCEWCLGNNDTGFGPDFRANIISLMAPDDC